MEIRDEEGQFVEKSDCGYMWPCVGLDFYRASGGFWYGLMEVYPFVQGVLEVY